MVAAVTVFLENVQQQLSLVWMELTMAGIAAVLYFVLFSGKAKKSKGSKIQSSSGSPKVMTPSYDQDLTPVQLATKALRQGKMIESIDLIVELPETKEGNVSDCIAHRLLIVATRAPRSSEVMSKLKVLAGKIQAGPLEVAVTDALKNRDFGVGRQLHVLSDYLCIPKSPATLEALVSINASDMSALRLLLKEAETPLSSSFAQAMVEACAKKDPALMKEVLEMDLDCEVDILRAAAERVACAPDDAEPVWLSRGNPQGGSDSSRSASESPRTGAAGEATSKDSGQVKPTQSQKEVAMRANDIRSCGKNGDLRGAIKVFERLGSQAENTLLVNSMLDACVECNDIKTALTYFTQAQKLGLADVVSYNTMMKGHIAHGQEAEAKSLLTELSKKGIVATRASFHGLLNARVNARDLRGAWRLVEDMQAAGIHPNAVTCSILLKGKLNSLADVSRVLALIDTMEQPMDEVLFLSVVEACIRTGRLDLLSRQTEKFLKNSSSVCLTAPTFGSMIKAYGHARDVKRVWELWGQMISHEIQPTAVTLGCMVEALVANGCTSDAWELAQKMWKDKNTRALVNTVIYSSILKGFANAKETDKVLALYEEMRAHSVQPNTITFNTILNAFAQGGAMRRVPALLDDMKAANPPIEPDIVTYSTIIKGFCNSGSLDRALKVLEDMKASGKYHPDEVMYNSLLSGCAKEHRPDEALELLKDMKKSGVAPSNYTLSMLVKLMGRCRRLNQAFTMLEDISKEYNFKINIQVYTCLIQGCFNGGQANRALSLHDKVIREGLSPDAMTYSVLVRGCLQAGLTEKACEMVKCAYGLSSAVPSSKCTPPGLAAGCLEEVVMALGGPSSDAAKVLVAQVGDCGDLSSGKAAAGQQGRRAPARGPPAQPWRSGGYGAKKATEKNN